MQLTIWDMALGTVVLTNRQGLSVGYHRFGQPLPATFTPRHGSYDPAARSWALHPALMRSHAFPPELFLVHPLAAGAVATFHYLRDD